MWGSQDEGGAVTWCMYTYMSMVGKVWEGGKARLMEVVVEEAVRMSLNDSVGVL